MKVRIGFDKLDPADPARHGREGGVSRDADANNTAALASGAPAEGRRPDVDGRSVVFVVNADRLERRAISVGLDSGDQVEVISGVRAGERVVVEAPQTLKDGDKVKVQ